MARIHPEEFIHFVTLYEEVYREIKKVSASTMNTVTFQFESLKDENLPGSDLDKSPIVAAFGPLLDIFGLSVYPCLSVHHPDKLPLDYLSSRISSRTQTAIFETAWPTIGNDEHVQASYADWILESRAPYP